MFTLEQAIRRTRRYLKDMTTSVWTDDEIIDFLNEGLMRIKRKIPEYFYDLVEVIALTEVIQLEDEYKELPCIYAASRCFEQDEQHYRAVQRRNEFESDLITMETEIRDSYKYEQKINENTNPYFDKLVNDYVVDEYYNYDASDDEIPPVEI